MAPYRQPVYVVADHGSLSAASEFLAISQPAISAAIQKVETDYQTKLFNRERQQGSK